MQHAIDRSAHQIEQLKEYIDAVRSEKEESVAALMQKNIQLKDI
jgi:DNA-binding GntR family transcriptional regulator